MVVYGLLSPCIIHALLNFFYKLVASIIRFITHYLYIYKGSKPKPKLVDDQDGLISLFTEIKSERKTDTEESK